MPELTGLYEAIKRLFPNRYPYDVEDYIRENLSEYASKDVHELIAEAFTAYRMDQKTDLVLCVLTECGILSRKRALPYDNVKA